MSIPINGGVVVCNETKIDTKTAEICRRVY